MDWTIEKTINFNSDDAWEDGHPPFGLHCSNGKLCVMSYAGHWVGGVGESAGFQWSAGSQRPARSDCHIQIDLINPHYVTDTPDGKYLITSGGTNRIYLVDPNTQSASILIDGGALGLTDMGNCIFDDKGNLWMNEIQGCKIWQFSPDGLPLRTLGNGAPGFQAQAVPMQDAQFNWIYDMRKGPDGNLYVLDSKNYAVRRIDLRDGVVAPIAGTGQGGYHGDGGDALYATFGTNTQEFFDGPWSLSLDEQGNIYVGDTQNHVVRMIEKSTNRITTIAGNPNAAPDTRNSPSIFRPAQVNLIKICSMDYYSNRLYIPDWNGDLIILLRSMNHSL